MTENLTWIAGMRVYFLCAITVILLIPTICCAQGPIEVGLLEDGTKVTGLEQIWHDETGRSGISEAESAYLRNEFQVLRSSGSSGLKPGAFWSRFSLKNVTNSPLTMHIEYVDHQLLGLQAFSRNASSDEKFHKIASLSLENNFNLREIQHNRFVFSIDIPAGETSELMVKLSSDKLGFVFPSMRIWDPEKLRRAASIELMVMAFLSGGYLLMSMVSLACGIYTSRKIYYTYSVYALLKIAIWFTLFGYTHQYLFVDHFHWSYMAVCGALAIHCGIVYSRIFLQTKDHAPFLDNLLRIMAANAIFLLLSALLKLAALSIISVTIALLLYPVISIASYVRWRQGSTEAAVFGLAWALLVFGLVVQALRELGYVEHNFINYYWPPVASYIEMLAIMIATAMKVHRLNMKKEHAEHQYTRQLEISRSELEKLVSERTRELESAKRLAEREARVDSLTGVRNRRSFLAESENRLKLARRKGLSVGLLLFDIDYFKSINDNYGHAAGDEALRAFSQLIASHTRDVDVFGRIGGEEFALLLLSEPGSCVDTAERLRREIEQITLKMAEGNLAFTTSIGVACLGEECDIDTLLCNADAALYSAKRQGRNRVEEYSCPPTEIAPATA